MDDYYPAYARWLADWAKKFKSKVGTDLTAISVQNEPDFPQIYASCVFSAEQIADLVQVVGEVFEKEGLGHIKIAHADDMVSSFGYMEAYTMTIPKAAAQADIVAMHGYSNGVSPADNNVAASKWRTIYSFANGQNAAKKKLETWMTETSGFLNWDGGTMDGKEKPGAQDLGTAMFHAFKHGKISAWFWWRMSTSSSGWKDETLILKGNKLKQYHVSRQFFKFIRPGAVMVEVDDDADSDVGVIAFNHKKNNTLTLVCINSAKSGKEIVLQGTLLPDKFDMFVTNASKNCEKTGTVSKTVTLPSSSIVTLVGTGYDPPVSNTPRKVTHPFTVRPLEPSQITRVDLFSIDGTFRGSLAGAPARSFAQSAWNLNGSSGPCSMIARIHCRNNETHTRRVTLIK